MSAFSRIDVHEFDKRRKEGWEPYVLDVRAATEAAVVKLDFADRLEPHTSVASIATELPRDRDIVVHCKMGGRSAMACATLAGLGFDRLFNLEGGITAYAREIDTSLPTY